MSGYYPSGPSLATSRPPINSSRPKVEPPKSAQPLPPQREVIEYATFNVRGLAYPNHPHPTRLTSSKSHTSPILSLAFSSSGNLLATASSDRCVKLWSFSPKSTPQFSYHSTLIPVSKDKEKEKEPPKTTMSNPISHVLFSPLPSPHPPLLFLTTESTSRPSSTSSQPSPPQLHLINVSTRELLGKWDLQHLCQTLAFHPSGRQLVVGCFDRSKKMDYCVFLWEREKVLAAAEGEAVEGNTAPKWSKRTDVKLGEFGYKVPPGGPDAGREILELNSLSFSKSGRRMYAGVQDGGLYAWDFPLVPRVEEAVVVAAAGANVNGGDGMEVDEPSADADGEEEAAGEVEEAPGEGEQDKEAESSRKVDEDEDEEGRRRRGAGEGMGIGETPAGSPRVVDVEFEGEGEVDVAGAAGVAVEATAVEVKPAQSSEEEEEGATKIEEGSAEKEPEEEGQEVVLPLLRDADGDINMDGDTASSILTPLTDATPLTPGFPPSAKPAPVETPGDDLGSAVPEVVVTGAEGVDIEMKYVEEKEEEATVPEPQAAKEIVPVDVTSSTNPSPEPEEAKDTSEKEMPTPVDISRADEIDKVIEKQSKLVEQDKEEMEIDETPQPEPKMLDFLFRVQGNAGCMNCLDLDPRGRFLVTGGSDGLVNMLTTKEWIGMRAFDSYTEEVKILRFSHDGELIATTGDDRCIDIMSTATGTTLYRIPVKTNVTTMTWHPKQRILCYALADHASGVEGQVGDWYYVGL